MTNILLYGRLQDVDLSHACFSAVFRMCLDTAIAESLGAFCGYMECSEPSGEKKGMIESKIDSVVGNFYALIVLGGVY